MMDGDTKERLLAHAFAMIGEMALGEVTLRPLAERAGVSVATINHHFGNKQAVLCALVEASIQQEASFAARWTERLCRLGSDKHPANAHVVSALFDDWLAANRKPLLVLLDLLRAPDLIGDGPACLASWLACMGPFWSRAMFGKPEFAEVAFGYAIDEAGFAIGAGSNPSFVALRRLCLESLVTRYAYGQTAPKSDQHMFDLLVEELRPEAVPESFLHGSKRRRMIVEQAAEMLTAPRQETISHRSVAARCGISAATIVYQFGSTEDLIAAGLYALIEKFRRGIDGLGPSLATPLADLVRATGIIALAAARMPALSPHALDMRRRRGENVVPKSLVDIGVAQELADDPLYRQVMSVALFGMCRLAYAMGETSDEEATRPLLAFVTRTAASASPVTSVS
jgi:AcrR family transcriptional regulator